jgi:hypothetical protein
VAVKVLPPGFSVDKERLRRSEQDEMLTGRHAFQGDSAVEAMNAILKEDPKPAANGGPAAARTRGEPVLARMPIGDGARWSFSGLATRSRDRIRPLRIYAKRGGAVGCHGRSRCRSCCGPERPG